MTHSRNIDGQQLQNPCLVAWREAVESDRSPAVMRQFEAEVASHFGQDETEALNRAHALVFDAVKVNAPQRALALPAVTRCLRERSIRFRTAETITRRADYIGTVAHQLALAADGGMACLGPLQSDATLEENAGKFKKALNKSQLSFLESIAYAEEISGDDLQALQAFMRTHGPLYTRFMVEMDKGMRIAQTMIYEAIFSRSDSDAVKDRAVDIDADALRSALAILDHFASANGDDATEGREDMMRADLVRQRAAELLAGCFNRAELELLQEHFCRPHFTALLCAQRNMDQEHAALQSLPHVRDEIHAAQDAQSSFLGEGSDYQ